jgi:hypothetical protein
LLCAPGADAQVVAELPVVQVVRAAVAGPGKGRDLVALQAGVAGALGDRSSMSLARSSSGRPGVRLAKRCWLDRQVVDRQVRRLEGQRLCQVGAPAGQRLARQRVHQVEVEGVEGRAASSTAARAWARSCTRPSAFRCASSKLCTPTDRRVTPAARKARKRSRSKVPGLASSVISQPAPAAAGRGCRPAGGRCLGREQAGRAAADEDAVHRPAPDQRQRGLQVGAQGVEVALLGQPGAPPARNVRVEVAIGALAQTPGQVHVQRQRRQRWSPASQGRTGESQSSATASARACQCSAATRSARSLGVCVMSTTSARGSAPAWRGPPSRGGCARSSPRPAIAQRSARTRG